MAMVQGNIPTIFIWYGVTGLAQELRGTLHRDRYGLSCSQLLQWTKDSTQTSISHYHASHTCSSFMFMFVFL